jgi:hypothetical protein
VGKSPLLTDSEILMYLFLQVWFRVCPLIITNVDHLVATLVNCGGCRGFFGGNFGLEDLQAT